VNRKPEHKKSKIKKVDPLSKRIFLAEGIAAVREYLKYKPEIITDVFADTKNHDKAVALLKEFGVAKTVLPMSEDGRHAPIEASIELAPVDEYQLFADIEGKENDLIVAVDHITDPRNLGAIMRTAAFFGVKHVIAPSKRQVLLTQASVATAQGAFAVTDLVCVTNLVRSLRELQQKGYWVLGADMDGEAFQGVIGEYQKQIIVLGNEESGMSRLVSDACDRTISIESGSNNLESLNVSVAAGILINAFSPKCLT